MIHLQLPTTITFGGRGGACDCPLTYSHHLLLQSFLVVGVGLVIPPSNTHTILYYNHFWWWGGDCNSPSVTHTTLYYNHFWWWVWGLRFPFNCPHHTLLQSLLVVGVGLVISLQLPTPHSTTITSGGGCVACDSQPVSHTTLYCNHFLWWGWGF